VWQREDANLCLEYGRVYAIVAVNICVHQGMGEPWVLQILLLPVCKDTKLALKGSLCIENSALKAMLAIWDLNQRGADSYSEGIYLPSLTGGRWFLAYNCLGPLVDSTGGLAEMESH